MQPSLRRTLAATTLLCFVLAMGCMPRRRGGGDGVIPDGLGDDDDSAGDALGDDDDLTPGDDDDATSGDDDDSDGPGSVADSDGDGLTDAFELSTSGTNPSLYDSDGDGFGDGDEYLTYHFPTDGGDFPRTGDYPRHPRPASILAEGTAIGQVMPSWTRYDQHDELIDLHEFYGNVVLISIGAVW